jgi:hypothetical protein
MLVVRYFLFVGGALLALLFVADTWLPKLPAEQRADADLPVIRIHSDRKWPQAVVFDTSHPTIVAEQTTASAPPAATVADISAKARVREAFAQLQPADRKQVGPTTGPKSGDRQPPKRRIAKRRAAPPVMLVAQQPQFSLFGNNTW